MKHLPSAVTLVLLLATTGCQERPAQGANTGTPADGVLAAPPAPERPAPGMFVSIDPATVRSSGRAHCAIDRIGASRDMKVPVSVMPGREIVFSGWIAAPGNVVPDSFRIVLVGPAVLAVDAAAGAARPDVARVLNSESLANSGFNARVRLADAPEGEYTVSLAAGEPGSLALCETPVRILVGAAISP